LSIHKIVLTGGPCGGKSTGLSKIEQELTERGYKVFVVPETATELMTGGIKPSEMTPLDFQGILFELQGKKEELYYRAAQLFDETDKVVIFYDRGRMDGKTYMPEKDFKKMLKNNNTNETEVRDYYDCILHLMTAAEGAEKFYTLENNKARFETLEEARIVDKKIIKAWTGHPHLRIIDNSTNFEQKINRLMVEIYSFLGEPVPMEIERKYLIEMPNLEELQEKYSCTKQNIIQTYLKSDDKNTEVRIRQRGINGEYSYYLTKKQEVSEVSRIETEKKISKDEYLRLLMDADTSLKQIRKDRICFVYSNNYFELDIYPFWEDKAILEIELSRENQEIDFPPEIKIIKEVTEDKDYKNYSLAKGVKNI